VVCKERLTSKIVGVYNILMKDLMSKEMIKRDKQIKISNLKMEKNIDEVIKHFELEDNVRIFLEKAILKQKNYAPNLNKVAKGIIEKRIITVLKNDLLLELVKNVVIEMVNKIAYENFSKEKNRLKQNFVDNINDVLQDF